VASILRFHDISGKINVHGKPGQASGSSVAITHEAHFMRDGGWLV
jgi:hypothetical protein